LALGISAVAVVGGVVISAAYGKTDIMFFLEGGAYVLSLPLSLIPAFLVSRIYAAVSSPQTSPSV
jgi:ATP-dependent protease HslVU (ClpYQ) ATPase subunit